MWSLSKKFKVTIESFFAKNVKLMHSVKIAYFFLPAATWCCFLWYFNMVSPDYDTYDTNYNALIADLDTDCISIIPAHIFFFDLHLIEAFGVPFVMIAFMTRSSFGFILVDPLLADPNLFITHDYWVVFFSIVKYILDGLFSTISWGFTTCIFYLVNVYLNFSVEKILETTEYISTLLYYMQTIDVEILVLYNLFLYFILKIIVVGSARWKFFYFFILLLLAGYWGFLFSFDGIVFLLLLTELTLLFIFLLIYTTVNTVSQDYIIASKFQIIFFIISNLLVIYSCTDSTLLFTLKYYEYTTFSSYIVSSDFFIFFYFFFYSFPSIVIILAFLLGFFSIFFIFIFFILKTLDIKKTAAISSLTILRKQNLVHQSLVKSQLQTFQS